MLFVFYLLKKNDPLLHVRCKSMLISIGLAGNLKVKLRVHLFGVVFKQWNDYQVSLPALFNLKNRIY